MTSSRAPRRAAAAGKEPLPAELLERVAARFAALADPRRLALLQVLCRGEASVQQLAGATGLGQPNASRHLASLAAQGFVVRRRSGTSSYYALADATPQELCDLICRHLTARAVQEAALVQGRGNGQSK